VAALVLVATVAVFLWRAGEEPVHAIETPELRPAPEIFEEPQRVAGGIRIGSFERPENVPAKEIVVLHDPEGEKSLVIVFFDSEDDYRRGDEALNAMPTEDTPGKRSSVTKYQVSFRMAD